MSDDVSMGALSGTFAERSRAALAAGCDLVLHCNGNLDEMREVADASPLLAGEALRARAERALALAAQAQRHRSRAARARFANADEQPARRRSDRVMTAEIIPFEADLGRTRAATSPLWWSTSRASKARSISCSRWRASRRSISRRFPSSRWPTSISPSSKRPRKLRLELAADYLVMAAWLAYLKSRLLLPDAQPAEGQSAEDMATALAFRLKRLEAFRVVAQQADGPAAARARCFQPRRARADRAHQASAMDRDASTICCRPIRCSARRPRSGRSASSKRTVWSLAEARDADRAADRSDRRLEPARSVSDRLRGRTGA